MADHNNRTKQGSSAASPETEKNETEKDVSSDKHPEATNKSSRRSNAEHNVFGNGTMEPPKPTQGTRGRPFPPGTSGNPKGRPKGALGWKNRAAKEILGGDIEEIMKRAVELAKSGDPAMIKFCLSLAMRHQEELVEVDTRNLDSPEACRDAIGEVANQTLDGEMSLGDAKRAIEIIEKRKSSFQMSELENAADARFERKILMEFLAKYQPGKSKSEDRLNLFKFLRELRDLDLPQENHEAIHNGYMDFLLEHGKLASTPEGIVDEIDRFLRVLEKLEAMKEKLGDQAMDDYMEPLLERIKKGKSA